LRGRSLVAEPSHTAHGQLQSRSGRNLLVGMVFSTTVAILGWRRGALAPSGVPGAIAVGTATYAAGTWRWSAVLLTFFVSSSALSRLERRKAQGVLSQQGTGRGAHRNLTQTLANGGVGAAAALIYAQRPTPARAASFVASVAAANADTWATEIGGASTATPRMIHTGKIAAPGTSGAVTMPGLLAAACGSACIAVVSLGAVREFRNPRYLAAVTAAGFAGALADSFAGALLQARYYCPGCNVLGDDRIHDCGTVGNHVSGRQWCTNDAVNVLCTLVGAATGALLVANNSRRSG
jgi:uncharacterized protein (TIGR00297 family)